MAYNNRGFCKFKMKEFEDALKDFDEAIRLSPTLAMAYSNRGLCKTSLQNFDDAIADLDKAIELDSGLMYAYHNKGRVLLLKEDYVGVIACFSKAISLKPDYALAYVLRAAAYHENGDKELALSDLSRDIDSTSTTLPDLKLRI